MMGFFMSFLLLVIAIYGFEQVSREAADEESRAVYTDIAGRIANGVLRAVDVGVTRVGSTSTARSEEVLYQQVLLLPVQVHGQQYRATLTPGEVTVTSVDGRIRESAITFNLRVSGGNCEDTMPVCQLSGTFLSNANGVRIKYEYKSTGPSSTCNQSPVASCVTIS